MKRVIFALFVILSSFNSSFAGRHPSQEELAVAMKDGRKQYALKEAALNQALKTPNTDAARTAVDELLKSMQTGMRQTQHGIVNVTGDEQLKAIKHYNEMEAIVHKYTQLSKDIPANSKQLVDQAAAFAKMY